MKPESSYLKHISTGPINPYLAATRVIYHRLKFDLRSLSLLGNYWKIKKWKNRHWAEKCVIMCNGPSLNQVDFDRLDESGVFTIGLNKINLLFDRMRHRPGLIACVNPFVIEQNKEFFAQTNIPLFLDHYGIRVNGLKPRYFNHQRQLHLLDSTSLLGTFAGDVSWSVCQGSTVTYVALQIAYHLGFKEVALVGCDHNFAAKGRPNETIQLQSADLSHFDPNYFSTADQWQVPDLISSEYHYQVAREAYIHTGRKVYNATVGGNLEVFERLPLDEFLSRPLVPV